VPKQRGYKVAGSVGMPATFDGYQISGGVGVLAAFDCGRLQSVVGRLGTWSIAVSLGFAISLIGFTELAGRLGISPSFSTNNEAI
jgi:hypothetical protein